MPDYRGTRWEESFNQLIPEFNSRLGNMLESVAEDRKARIFSADFYGMIVITL